MANNNMTTNYMTNNNNISNIDDSLHNNFYNNFYNNLDIYLIGLYCICGCFHVYKNMIKQCTEMY